MVDSILIYLVIGWIFYLIIYVKQEGVERVQHEWVRGLFVILFYPVLVAICLVCMAYIALEDLLKFNN